MKLRNNWRAGYAETCMSGSEGGSQKPGLATGNGAGFLPYKSTSAANIAFGLVRVLRQANVSNPRVLLVDTDSQAHATLITTGRRDYGREDSLYTVVTEREQALNAIADATVPSLWDEDLHVLPASPLLDIAERELTGVAGAPYRLAEPLSRIASQYGAIVIDTRPSFSLMTEMALLAATDAIVPVEPRYLETVGLLAVVQKINEIRDGWRHPDLHVSGLVVTKMDHRIKGHLQMLDELKAHPLLGKLLLGVIPSNEAVTYAHRNHMSIYEFDPRCAASRAYAELVAVLAKRLLAKEVAR